MVRFRNRITHSTVTGPDDLRDGSAYAERHVFPIPFESGAT